MSSAPDHGPDVALAQASPRPDGRGEGRRRWPVLALLGVVGLALAVLVVELVGGSGGPGGGVADNASAISLASVTRRPLSSQTQVSGTLGYTGASSILVPGGASPSSVVKAAGSDAASEAASQAAAATLSADRRVLAVAQAGVSAAREKQSVDCAGVNAAETPQTGSSAGGDSSSGPCSSDQQALAADEQVLSGDASKVTGDQASVAMAATGLAGAQSSLSAARSTATLSGQGSTFTWLPAAGRVIGRGQRVYAVDGQPVLLLYGPVLASRPFQAGMSAGPDVGELNANLDALGAGRGLAGEDFGSATAAAIRAFQSARGLRPTGQLLLGSVVFESAAVRVTSVTPALGATVAPGPVLGITSAARQVTIGLDAADQALVKVGDAVAITLPDNQTTPGRVTYVASVARETSNGSGGSSPTISVDAVPTDPAATSGLDQAPVEVSITTASVPSALVVPVDALLALSGGGYALEEVPASGPHRLVGVGLGLFDDADGLVEVTGAGLAAGARVVVPGQ
ncbi:MAG TPA: peptidoglycan-binding domain-containing protein [Solirubrobacteraceae bacterium]|jgi:peptidoglycan hydrolase-like protein with peptidoglycan-binding domain|nr:peptidoglycan-binding domain-containing protein [Solirubrobacteraceae bacterium]